MQHFGIAILSLLLGSAATVRGGGSQFVDEGHIRVFLFGEAAYFSEVAIDLVNNTCLGLDNNMLVCRDYPPWRLLTSAGLTGKCNPYWSAGTTFGTYTKEMMSGIASFMSALSWEHL